MSDPSAPETAPAAPAAKPQKRLTRRELERRRLLLRSLGATVAALVVHGFLGIF